MKKISYIIVFFFCASSVHADSLTGYVGFYDGITHPVLGFDHFLAMVSVGIVSAQIGGRAIWTVPLTFVSIMLIGGSIGIYLELSDSINPYIMAYFPLEPGIIISVIILGLAVAIGKKLSVRITMVCVGIFGFFHGAAHGLEMPLAVNPSLFALGFVTSTAALHILGVIIGYFGEQSTISSRLLRIGGVVIACIGVYALAKI